MADGMPSQRGNAVAVGVCALMLAAFAALAWSAVKQKCATCDEPLHAAAGWAHWRYADFRVDPEDPPLFEYWAMLVHGRDALNVDLNDPLWKRLPAVWQEHGDWCGKILYLTPGNNGEEFIQRSRAAMLLLGVGLGVLIVGWAWKLAGAAAGVTAAALYSLDPNFLAHAPLVKNDVPFSLVLAAAMLATWLVGRRATWLRLASLSLLVGAALTVKFSGVMVGPVVAILLFARSMMKSEWPFLGWRLSTIRQRLTAAALTCGAVALVGWICIWAAYAFRYAPTPQGAKLDSNAIIERIGLGEAFLLHPKQDPSPQEIARYQQEARLRPTLFVRLNLWAQEHRLLPQAWLHGLLFTRMSMMARKTFLLDDLTITGWWYYFPLTMLFKTPIATIGVILVVAVYILKRTSGALGGLKPFNPWTLLVLGIPFLVYGIGAVTTNLNLGLRHVLPLYPFMYIAAGWAAARLYAHRPRGIIMAAAVVFPLLAVECLWAYPNFIPFFNLPSAHYGKLHLLGDSNLDWGQDLPRLAEWQRKNPGKKLYLCYFGWVWPGAYGIEYQALPHSWDYVQQQRSLPPRNQPVVWAISATHLQGIYLPTAWTEFYRQKLLDKQPLEVLGESIYLYEAVLGEYEVVPGEP